MIKQILINFEKFCDCSKPLVYWSVEVDGSLALHCLKCDTHFVCENSKLVANLHIDNQDVAFNTPDLILKRDQNYHAWLNSKNNSRHQQDMIGIENESVTISPIVKIAPNEEKNKVAWYRNELESFLKQGEPKEESEVVVSEKPELIH